MGHLWRIVHWVTYVVEFNDGVIGVTPVNFSEGWPCGEYGVKVKAEVFRFPDIPNDGDCDHVGCGECVLHVSNHDDYFTGKLFEFHRISVRFRVYHCA